MKNLYYVAKQEGDTLTQVTDHMSGVNAFAVANQLNRSSGGHTAISSECEPDSVDIKSLSELLDINVEDILL